VRTSSSVESSDVPADWLKSTVFKEFSILLCPNKVSPDSLSVLPLPDTLLLQKSNSEITFSQLLIKLLMKPPNTGIDQVANSTAENWHSDQLGVLLDTALCITLNLPRHISVTLQALRLSSPEIQFRPRDCFWLQSEIQTQLYFLSPKPCIEMPKPMSQLEISSLIWKRLKLLIKVQISQSSAMAT